jgi:gamma-glutamyl-gamma-aminobutyraldehyde dehydrogenase
MDTRAASDPPPAPIASTRQGRTFGPDGHLALARALVDRLSSVDAAEDEAIALANATSYGLAASLWTTNIDTAIRVARSIRAGTVSVNSYSESEITTPFGGYKESGFGDRDKGLEAFDQYTEQKTIWITLRG